MPPSSAAITTFFQEINMAENKPAILKITQPYAQEFIPKLCCSALPTPMMELYNPEALHMSYLTLLETCESAFQSITVRIIVLKWLQAKKLLNISILTDHFRSGGQTWSGNKRTVSKQNVVLASSWTSNCLEHKSSCKNQSQYAITKSNQKAVLSRSFQVLYKSY